MNNKKKGIELYKTKKIEKKSFVNKIKVVKKSIKTRKINIIGKIDSIASLLPEQMNAIIFGEVFKIDVIQFPNNKFIYKIL